VPPSSKLPKYVNRVRVGGRYYYYFRVGGKHIGGKLPEIGTPEFHADYAKRLAGIVSPKRETFAQGTVRALLAEYKASPDWTKLRPKTQRDYERQLVKLAPIYDEQAADIKRSAIVQMRNLIASATGNRTADLFVAACSAMFRVGLDLPYGLEVNPCHDIRPVNEAEEFEPWSAKERQAFETSDMPEWMRTAYMIGLWTALRLDDVLSLARARYDGDGFDVRHSKTAETGYIPAVPVLRGYLAQLPRDRLLWVVDEKGKRIPNRRFSGALREHLNSLGFPGLSFHGLRGTTATALAEAGASDQEIASITGHKSVAMVRKYTRKARQKVLAKRAMKRLSENENGT